MAEKYYQFVDDPAERWGAYRSQPMHSGQPELGTYRSTLGVSEPRTNDFLILSESSRPEVFRPSDPAAFNDVEFEHVPTVSQLIEKGTIRELTPDECQNFLSLRTSIEQVTNRISDIQKQMMLSEDAQLFIDLKQQEIDLHAALMRLQLGLQIPETAFDTQWMNAALISSMQAAGFRQVSPSVMSTELRFENPRTGQIHAFDNAQQAQAFLDNRSVAVTLYYHYTNSYTEEVPYYAGEEKAALDAYRSALDELGPQAVEYNVELDAAYDHLGYQLLCAYADAYGYEPSKSEVEYISNRDVRRMEHKTVTAESPNTALELQPEEIAAIAYTEPSGDRVELHFNPNEADTALYAFQNIMEQDRNPEVVVADTAPDLDYELYQKYCDATGTDSRLTKDQFMARFHLNAAGERTMQHDAADPLIGEGVGFERIRRITGYLVGDLDRFNNAKRAEVRDRLPHGTGHAPVSLHSGAQKTIDGPEM